MKRIAVLVILTTFFSSIGISEIPAIAKLPDTITPAVSAAELGVEKDVWNGEADYSWYDNQESPYTISTAAQFAAFGNILNKLDGRDDRFAGKTIHLAADLDMAGKPFRAMGGHADDMVFAGTFEGQGHIISNLNITQAGLSSNYVALFARLSGGGAIRDLGLEGVTVDVSGAVNQAAFVGQLMDGSIPVTIENCFVRDADIKVTLPLPGGSRVGGFVANINDYPLNSPNTIKNCYAVNVRLSRKDGDGSAEYGFGHFAGLSEGGVFINCYSGGITEQPSDSVLPAKTMSFGILRNGVADNNCYSDCYADDGGLEWFFSVGGYKRGGSNVSADDLKRMSGAASALSENYYICDIEGYNSGYPILLWEILRFKEPPIKLSVEKKTGNSVIFDAIDGAEFSANGRDWQSDREFRDLPPGVYVFRARRDSESTKLTVTIEGIDAWDGVSADYSWYDNQESPYTISTAAQFAAFGNILNKLDGRDDRFAGKTIHLAADLDMAGKSFRAMGGHADDMVFAGTFEGQGHIISNLNITQAGLSSNYVALFARLSGGGAIRDLGLEGVTVDVSGAVNQAAFVGQLMDGSIPVTIENCFVRDADIKVTITNDGRVGGFAAVVSNYPENTTLNTVKNCYTVNVRFSRGDGEGNGGYGFGHFAGLSEGGEFINCYSGGVTGKPSDSVLPNRTLSFGILKNGVKDTNCYSDCYADDGALDWFFENGFKRGGSKVSTSDLKGMTGDVALGAEFAKAENNSNNYGYPQLLWELDESNQIDKFSAASFELTDNGSTAQVNVSGLKNNLADSIKPLLFIISYKNGRIAAINTKEIEMEAYDYEPDVISLSVDMSGADSVRAFMLKGADNVVPVLDSKEAKK